MRRKIEREGIQEPHQVQEGVRERGVEHQQVAKILKKEKKKN